MEQKKNKIVAIIIILLILITIVLGVVYMTRKDDSGGGIIGAIGGFPTDYNITSSSTDGTDDGIRDGEYIPAPTPVPAGKKPILEKIAEGPVAGAVSFLSNNTEIVRYVEKNTGAIQEINMDTDKTSLMSKRTIQKIHDAYWEGNGEKVIIRYLDKKDGADVIKTYWTYVDTTETIEKVGDFFPDGIREIAISGDGSRVIYICDKNCNSLAEESAFGISSDFKNTGGGQQMFYSPLKQWNLQWPTDNVLALTIKPSINIDGYTYLYNDASENLEKVIGEKPGLTTLYSTDGQKVLLAESGSSYQFSVYDLYEKTEKNIAIQAIPEKCVWGNNETNMTYCSVPKNFNTKNFPDTWYQGGVNFTDNIWAIDTDSLSNTNLALKLKEESGEDIDAVKLFLGNNDNYLYFTNRIDGSLWVYRMVQ